MADEAGPSSADEIARNTEIMTRIVPILNPKAVIAGVYCLVAVSLLLVACWCLLLLLAAGGAMSAIWSLGSCYTCYGF